MNANGIRMTALTEWWTRQQVQGRRDLYALRLDRQGNVIGTQLRDSLNNQFLNRDRWVMINDGSEGGIDWGYVWFGFRKLSWMEGVYGSRHLTVYTSRWQTERILKRNYFLYVAVDDRGLYGTFVTRSWIRFED